MAYRQIRVSDLSGEVIDDDKVVTVLVRQHPKLEEARVFDASPDELKGLAPMADVLELELRSPRGTVGTMVLTHEAFALVVGDDKLNSFDSSRGRRTGFRPNGS